MNLTEIVAKIKRKFPNTSLQDADIVKSVDTHHKRIYRKYKIPTKETFTILANTYAFDLGIKPSLIIEVLVDGVVYPKKQIRGGSTAVSRYHYFMDDYLAIYPTPTADATLTVFKAQTPPTLSSSNMGAIPTLDEDYHDMLVFGPSKELAEEAQTMDKASYYEKQYKELEDQLAEVFEIVPEVETIQSESGW